MMSEKLPNLSLKAQPHIISLIKTLKKECSAVYDMVYGQSTFGFGWDDNRKMVVADSHVRNAYLTAHKEAIALIKKLVLHFIELSMIYAKDHATTVDAQNIDDIIEEVAIEEHEERRKRSNKGDNKMQEAIKNALMMVGNELKGLGQNLKGIATETQMQESTAKLKAMIAEVDGLTSNEKMLAHYKLFNSPSLMFVFLGISLMNR
ncbi:hypothetical protein Ancab_024986 [Ancistrocladus abbreviatus]